MGSTRYVASSEHDPVDNPLTSPFPFLALRLLSMSIRTLHLAFSSL